MKRWLAIALGLTAAALAGSLYIWFALYDRLPDPLPIHWNIRGEANGWVARDSSLWVFLLSPGVMLLMVGLGLALPWLSPKGYDVERFRKTYEFVFVAVIALFAYIHLALMLQYLWRDFDGTRMLVGGIFLFFAVLGNVMGKTRRNFWLGIRTPWTLASEAVWIQTHRVAAWLYTTIGIAGALAVLLGASLVWVIWVFIGLVLLPIPYSLYLYKKLEWQGKLNDPPTHAAT